jgi:hypothetical protein
MRSIAKRLFCVVYLLLSCGPLLAQSRPQKIPAHPFDKNWVPASEMGRPPIPPEKKTEEMKRSMQLFETSPELKTLGGKIQKKLIDLDESEMKRVQGGQDISGTKSDISGGETLEAEYLFLAKSMWDRARIQREALEARGFLSARQFELISKILDTSEFDHIHVFAASDSSASRSCLPYSVYVDVKVWSQSNDLEKERIILRDLSQLISRMEISGASALTAEQQNAIVNFVSASEDVIHRYDPLPGSRLNGGGYIRAIADGNGKKTVLLKIRKTSHQLQLLVKDETNGREKAYNLDPTDVIYNPVTCEPDRFPERQNIRYQKKASDLLDTSFFYGSMSSEAKRCAKILSANDQGQKWDVESLWVMERGNRLLFCIAYFPVGVRK